MYNVNDWQLYASYSHGQKEPNRDDFEAGTNEQPKREKLHDFELGVEKKRSDYNWGATLYYMLYKDQLVLTGKINDVGSYTRTNVPESYRMGIELQGGIRFTPWLNVAGNLTLSRNIIDDFNEFTDAYDANFDYLGQHITAHGTTDIALSPDVTGAGTINILPVKNLEISLLGKYVSRQYLDNTSNKSRSLNAYYVQDARMSYTLRNWGIKEATVIFQANNVFDKKYEPNGYTFSYAYDNNLITENYYFPMAGRNVMVGLNIKL